MNDRLLSLQGIPLGFFVPKSINLNDSEEVVELLRAEIHPASRVFDYRIRWNLKFDDAILGLRVGFFYHETREILKESWELRSEFQSDDDRFYLFLRKEGEGAVFTNTYGCTLYGPAVYYDSDEIGRLRAECSARGRSVDCGDRREQVRC